MTDLIKLALVAATVWFFWANEAPGAEHVPTEAFVLVAIVMDPDTGLAAITSGDAYLWAYECGAALDQVLDEAQGGLLAASCELVTLPPGVFWDLFAERI